MWKYLTVGFAMLALAVVAGGCGGSDDASAGGDAASTTSREDAALAFAQCMREQGIEVDDPQGGRFTLKVDRANAEKFEAAQEKCRKQVPGAFQEPSEEEKQRMQEAALAFARCMRAHGVDVPDPKFENGGVLMQSGPGAERNPRFEQAEKACRKHMPGPETDEARP
jgi:hypothetical protein